MPHTSAALCEAVGNRNKHWPHNLENEIHSSVDFYHNAVFANLSIIDLFSMQILMLVIAQE